MHIKKGYTLTGKESDEKTGYGYFPHQARQTSTGHIPLLCPCQRPTISLPTPTMVGEGWAFVGIKNADLTFIRKTGAALQAEAGQPAFTTAAMAETMRIRAEATIQRRGRSLTCWRPYMMPR